jgi:hypothetical protein
MNMNITNKISSKAIFLLFIACQSVLSFAGVIPTTATIATNYLGTPVVIGTSNAQVTVNE